MRDFDELKLARVIDACDGIDGRVKMQKIVYLLKVMGYDLPFDDFVIRQHGPFSRSVAWATDVLTGAEILIEKKEELSLVNEAEPVVQYSYRVRDEIAPLIRENFDIAAPGGKPKLDEIASRLKKNGRAVLEVAATRVFLEREGLFGKKLDDELHRLKGHLSGDFDKADELLGELRKESLL